MGNPLVWQVATESNIETARNVAIGGETFEANTAITTVDPFPPASSFLIDVVDRPLFDVIWNTPDRGRD